MRGHSHGQTRPNPPNEENTTLQTVFQVEGYTEGIVYICFLKIDTINNLVFADVPAPRRGKRSTRARGTTSRSRPQPVVPAQILEQIGKFISLISDTP